MNQLTGTSRPRTAVFDELAVFRFSYKFTAVSGRVFGQGCSKVSHFHEGMDVSDHDI